MSIDRASNEHGLSNKLQPVVLACIGAVLVGMLLASVTAPPVDGAGWGYFEDPWFFVSGGLAALHAALAAIRAWMN